MPTALIRPGTAADFDAWLPLWRGYQQFYKTDIPHETTLTTWQRLLSPDEPMRDIAPGESLVYRFRAEHAGIWLYHCATMPMSHHIAAGMHGAVIIDPPNLPPVDHEVLLVQSEGYWGDAGPDTPVAKAAPGQCRDCGFLVPLAGALGRVFGACANAMAPDDGRVVALTHGCGAHSETVVEAAESSWSGMAKEHDGIEVLDTVVEPDLVVVADDD